MRLPSAGWRWPGVTGFNFFYQSGVPTKPIWGGLVADLTRVIRET